MSEALKSIKSNRVNNISLNILYISEFLWNFYLFSGKISSLINNKHDLEFYKTDMGEALNQKFSDKNAVPGLSRRDLLRGFAATGIALAIATTPFASDADAGEAQASTLTPGQRGLDAVQGRRDMRKYSKLPNTRGIGAFINLQANAPVTGDQIGKWIQAQFAGIENPIPVDYRTNQSRGTTTDITFYVRGYDFTLNIEELQARLREILAHHRDVWPQETASLSKPSVAR